MIRKITFLYCCLLLIVQMVFAQTIQLGQTVEYNEKNEKIPLGGVEIVIRDAGSTVSDANGNFTLTFNTLKPGDKVVYRQIQKSGYEIFNKQALEQWYISREKRPFQIVLCRSDKFKALTENYQRISSASYARQYKNDQEKLALQLKEGKLKEEEYKKQLLRLEDNYYEQLKDLDNYVDMFARIDMSELSSAEQKIIEMLQEGRIDEAIKAYENKRYVEKFKQEASDIVEINEAQKRLEIVEAHKKESMQNILAAIERQISSYQLIGGYENYKKIGSILREVALADTTNLDVVRRYAEFAHEQNDFTDAYRFYSICVNGCNTKKQASVYTNMGSLCRLMKQYDEGKTYLQKSIEIYENMSEDDRICYASDFANAENNLGILYYSQQNYEDAEKYYLRACKKWQESVQKGNNESLPNLAGVQNNLGILYMKQKKLVDAEKYYSLAVDTYSLLCETNSNSYQRYLAVSQNNLGALYFDLGKYEDAEKYWTLAANDYEKLYEKNPNAYAFDLGILRYNLARFYNAFKRYTDSERAYTEALNIFKPLYEKNPNVYVFYVAETYNSLSYAYAHLEKYDMAIQMVNKAIELAPSYVNYYDSKGDILVMKNDLESAKLVLDKILEFDSSFIQTNQSEWVKKIQ
ncbi:MAG: tetratricopeptide repeat protein [Bacteroidales bacterium]|nr:tetratricopeptide repeat protein [Bacteroidales bacterium]